MSPRLLSAHLMLPGHTPEDVFPFFADARNLERLTPPWLSFSILGRPPLRLGEGTLIDYQLRLHGVPLRWQSEITRWEPPFLFEDTQRRGPYRLWRHTHRFEGRPQGTLTGDEVLYAPPLGFLGDLLVRRDLRRIFEYRARALAREFGVPAARPSLRFSGAPRRALAAAPWPGARDAAAGTE